MVTCKVETGSGADTWWQYSENGEAAWVGMSPGGSMLQLDWDGLGMLRAVSDGSDRHDFTYAPSGLRVGDVRTGADPPRGRRFAYASGGALPAVHGTGTGGQQARTDVVHAGGLAIAEIDQDGRIFELHSDHLGSPRHVTDGGTYDPAMGITGATGRVVGEQAFGPYGERMVGAFSFRPRASTR